MNITVSYFCETMKVSKVITKAIVRVFFILLLVAIFPFIHGDQSKYKNIYFSYHHPWQIVFPAIVIISFIVFFIKCAIKRYEDVELNWLLVVNTIILIAYGLAVFIKVSALV